MLVRYGLRRECKRFPPTVSHSYSYSSNARPNVSKSPLITKTPVDVEHPLSVRPVVEDTNKYFGGLCNPLMSDIQAEELETLEAIFGDEFSRTESSYKIRIMLDEKPENSITLLFEYLPEYPKVLPNYTLSAKWLTPSHNNAIQEKFQSLFEEHEGEPIIYVWVDYLMTTCVDELGLEDVLNPAEEEEEEEEDDEEESFEAEEIPIMVGAPLTDRKSKFQAFIAKVESVEDTEQVLRQLLSNKKIANATHNMVAYRIADKSSQKYIEFRDDDGEGGAGDKMLYVLQAKKAENLMVVVSRWYGGIQLGQTRFKHIADLTTEILSVYREKTGGATGSDSNGDNKSKEKSKGGKKKAK
eukprot:TRINITY_DN2483_c2_g1_i1.p1 TRINITY_DN2483_c2_g1~~TRINITY_DN2483_c2_g1_i1.p1  ORF type:complete len:355 (-),score=84.30 TRINITY_DN2483_c2_g1_i1:229-1293(-)